jgi:hypothetical protein
MTSTPWLWPLCETLHFIGLALLIGVAGLFDLRMLGVLRRVSLAAVMDLRGWAALGLAINLITGLMFFVGAPDQYIHNPAWCAKVGFITIAGLNILAFELSPRTKALVAEIGPGDTRHGGSRWPLACRSSHGSLCSISVACCRSSAMLFRALLIC